MKLPVISQPLFELNMPSTGKKTSLRPYLVNEEKILLLAKQSGDEKDILNAVKQVINNCIQDDEYDSDKLTTFDLEYLFLKLRAKSVDNIVELRYTDNEEETPRDFTVDLNDIEVEFNPENDSKIKINDDVYIVMKYPLASISEKIEKFDNDIDLLLFFISNCIESIYDKENVYLLDDYSKEEQEEFINSFPVKTLEGIKKYFDTLPRLYHKIEYTNINGKERKIELSNLRDFFILD